MDQISIRKIKELITLKMTYELTYSLKEMSQRGVCSEVWGVWVKQGQDCVKVSSFLGSVPARRGNNGVSWYPRYQKIFGLTENFD